MIGKIDFETITKKYTSLSDCIEKYRAEKLVPYNFFSYGNIKGNFNIPLELIPIFVNDNYIIENYGLVEKKTEYYKLMFDFDYKDKEYFDIFHNHENEYTEYIIDKINLVLNDVFKDGKIEYIFCDKNIGEGIHLYYPDIIVNKIIHQEILKRVFDSIIKDTKYNNPKNYWNKVIDGSISKANGLRLPYFEANNNYYKINYEKTTYKLSKNIQKDILFCCINTNEKYHKPELNIKINEDDIINEINKNGKKIEKINFDGIVKNIDLDINKDFMTELLNILSVTRLDNYESWIDIVCLCSNYNLYDECIAISKKSKKYNVESENIITRIFNKNEIPNNCLTFGSLIKWCKEDNYDKCASICNKYNMRLKLEINNLDDLLIKGIKYDIIEDNKYISKKKEIFNYIKNGIRTFLIHSPTGSGKTTVIQDIIKFYNNNCIPKYMKEDDVRILSIVSRRSMCGTHLKAFDKLKLESYLNCNEYKNRYISSVEHLKFIKDEQYNILILDEINSLLSYFYSNTLDGRRLKCFENLCKIISEANLVLCCDSNITNMVHQFIEQQREIFGNVIRYRNINKNKINVNMNIYQSNNKNENWKIVEFMKLLKNDIENYNSVLILSDSKKITIKIKEALQLYNSDENYYKLINKDYGTIDEIINCNEQFKNKCIISSPKILYGVDITIPYDNIYCIYKYTGNTNCINSMEYHQQYSRARICNNVNILDLNHNYKFMNNYYISLDDHILEEDKIFENKKKNQNEQCKKYKIINEMCEDFNLNKNIINKQNIFSQIHYYKTWFDKLFNNNKMQLVIKLAEEAGYNINFIELELNKDSLDQCKKLKQSVTNYEKEILEIIKKIIETSEDIKDYRLRESILEGIFARMKYFGIHDIKDIYEDLKEFIINIDKFKTNMNKKYLNLSKDNFDKFVIQINNKEIPQFSFDNKIIKKIYIIEELENIFGINRFKINDIKTDINIKKIKDTLISKKENIIKLDDDATVSNKILLNQIIKKINKITSYNLLQKFICDCYNKFGDIIQFSKHRKRINTKLVTVYHFNDYINDVKENFILHNNDVPDFIDDDSSDIPINDSPIDDPTLSPPLFTQKNNIQISP